MGARPNFTVERLAALNCQKGKSQSIHWDGKTPGLGLRVTAAGARAFIFEARLNAKTLRITIGSPDVWPLETQWRADKETGKKVEFRRGAREEAQRLRALVDQGQDPRQLEIERQAAVGIARSEATRRELTVSKAWAAYIQARKKRWSERHLADHINVAYAGGDEVAGRGRVRDPGALASMMRLKLAEIDPERVRIWLTEEAMRRPTQAALAYRLFRAFLNWCDDTPAYKGIAAPGACQTRIAKDTLPKKQSKSDCLQKEQLQAWFAGVRSIDNPVISSYLQILLLVGSRREELAHLKWTDIDFRWKAITIRDKVEGERTVPLTPYVESLLLNLKRINNAKPNVKKLRAAQAEANTPVWKPSTWAFFSKGAESGRLQEPSIQHRKVTAAAGIDGLTLHGLRRSFSTLTEWLECPAGVVAQIMGHKPSATAEKHYKVRPLDLLRVWHTKIEAWMLAEAKVNFVPAVDGVRAAHSS